MERSRRLLAGAAAGALLAGAMASAGHAQTAPTGAPSGPETTLQEVVVTAQKRVENAQKAPLAVTSLNADALAVAHVTGATDLSRVVPDVRVSVGGAAGDPGGSSAVFSIRGLGASATGPQGSAGVAVHVDGVYSQVGISNSEFFDLERVEVDPGPQGTLYGRSAAAGAVNVIPNKPTHVFGGSATIELGNYDAVRSEAVLNVPVNDQLALRGAFQSQNHDGYLSNGYDDLDAKAGRLQALWTPTPVLSVRLYGDYLQLGGRGASNVFVSGDTLPTIAAVAPPLLAKDPRDRSIAQYCLSGGKVVASCIQNIDITKWSVHAEISYNLGWGMVTLLPSYSERNQTSLFSNAPLPLSYYNLQPFDDHQTNVELRLNDPGRGSWKWVVGFNYYHNEVSDTVNQSVAPLAGPLPQFGPGGVTFAPGVLSIQAANAQESTQESYAVFGQTTYAVRPWLRLTVGGRYNADSADYTGVLTTFNQTLYYLNGPAFPPFPGSPDIVNPISTGALSSHASFDAFTYRVAVDADVTPTSLVYASVGSGYKPGGLSDGASPDSNTPGALALLGSQLTPPQTGAQVATFASSNVFGPEKVTHYEVGSKNRFLGNRLQINDALYFDDYSNYQNGQTQVISPLIYRIQGFIVTNAGQAQVYGNELSAKFQVTAQDQLSASLNYLHANFTRYLAPGFLTPAGSAPALDLNGKPLPNAPEWSGTAAYQHVFDLANGADLTAAVFTALSGGYWTDYAETPGTHQAPFTRTTVDLTWRSPDQKWRVTAFVSNLEDSLVKSFGLNSAGYGQVHYDPPRLFGASVSRTF